jgi:hypothetical protein
MLSVVSGSEVADVAMSHTDACSMLCAQPGSPVLYRFRRGLNLQKEVHGTEMGTYRAGRIMPWEHTPDRISQLLMPLLACSSPAVPLGNSDDALNGDKNGMPPVRAAAPCLRVCLGLVEA